MAQVDFSSYGSGGMCVAAEAPRPQVAAGLVAKRPRIGKALQLENVPTMLLNIPNAKPLAALELLRNSLPSDPEGLAVWRHSARVAAVMGSCPHSKQSFKSGGPSIRWHMWGSAWLSMLCRFTPLDHVR